jgi:alkanesulfonate monooxygenase SsuD/methylene tetrahydromethanopterin reductase-like flavin-dependent oxidoreductase (luciferase family)
MRIGLQVPNFTWPTGQGLLGETFGLLAQRAEHAGFFSLWVMDPEPFDLLATEIIPAVEQIEVAGR